jgi:hypothetical protein
VTDEQVGPEDVAAAIRAHQAPSEVVDDAGAPAPADDDSADRNGAADSSAQPNAAANRPRAGEGS